MRLLRILFLALCAACGASTDKPDPGRVRPVGELPPAYEELWRAWVEDAPDWRERQRAAAADPKLTSFLVDNLVRTLLRGLQQGAFTTLDSTSLGPFERARAELVRLGPYATPSLAADLLIQIGRPSVLPLCDQLERDDNVQARQRAADILAQLPYALESEPDVRGRLIAHLESDPDWLVRKMCARAIGERGAHDVVLDESRIALCRALVDEDSEVTREAAKGLVRLDDPVAIPALINYLQRSMAQTRIAPTQTAQGALMALTGETRARDPRGWRAWWRENRPAPRESSRQTGDR